MKRAVRERIQGAPGAPGVYLFKRRGEFLYIGKASHLRNRLAAYLGDEKRALADQADELDLIVTRSDTEALTLEESLIKIHQPRHNIRLKDDKKFPYLKITTGEDFPRIYFTRDLDTRGACLFGPYTSARALRRTHDALCRVFRLASCTRDFSRGPTRPCLEHAMGRCSAPCAGLVSQADYATAVDRAIRFLRGQSDELASAIEEEMWRCAKEERFEAAQALRDQLLAIRKINEQQPVVVSDGVSRDVIGLARSGVRAVACLFKVRSNRLFAKENYELRVNPGDDEAEICGAFIRLIYTHVTYPPARIVAGVRPAGAAIQEHWFADHGYPVALVTAERKDERSLLEWAQRNAEQEIAARVLPRRAPVSLVGLQNALQLERPPRWIEAFDVSNIGDKYAVGASVAFKDGRPIKKWYRRYRIKCVAGQNDFAMIREIVGRRLGDLPAEGDRPDLLLIDGGKGQLGAALQAATELRTDMPIMALAKRSDELFLADGRIIGLPRVGAAALFIKRVRDEVHRFAIRYHRAVRSKSVSVSELDGIAGIGEKRKVALMKYFGSVIELRKASQLEISRVPGIGKALAGAIYEALHQ